MKDGINIKIVCISDTHLRLFQVPDGDILINSGDLTFDGSVDQVIEGFQKLNRGISNNYSIKLFCPGNHDKLFANNPGLAKMIAESYGWKVLHNELIEVNGLWIYGSAVQPEFCNWSFNYDDHYRQLFWKQAPKCDILVTHSPPFGAGDKCMDGRRVGCRYITEYIKEHKPIYNICGHIHSDYGEHQLFDTKVVNSSICNDNYKAINPPIIFSFNKKV